MSCQIKIMKSQIPPHSYLISPFPSAFLKIEAKLKAATSAYLIVAFSVSVKLPFLSIISLKLLKEASSTVQHSTSYSYREAQFIIPFKSLHFRSCFLSLGNCITPFLIQFYF